MKADKWFYPRCLVICSLIFLIGEQAAQAAQFSADIIQHIGAKSRKSKIYVKDSKYRMEEKEDGKQVIIMVDQKAGVTRVLVPAEKKYKEMKSTDMGSLMNDPIQAVKFSATMYQQKSLGVESINGYACDKSSLSQNDQLLITQWVSKKLMFHLKIVIHGTGGRTMALENIHEGPVDEALFQIPTGYAKMEDPKIKREREEAALHALTTTVSGSAPLARRIGPGGEIRVKVDAKKSVRFKIRNLIEAESVFTITAFRNNQPIKMDIEKTYALKLKGRRLEPLLGMQNRADEVAVKVDKGRIIAEIMVEESSFAKDKINSFFMMTGITDSAKGVYLDAGRLLRLSITGDSQDANESRVKVSLYKGSYKDKIDEANVVLKNGQAKTWEYIKDKGIKTLNIEVARGGGVKVRIEQPATEKAAIPQKAPKIVRTTPPGSVGKSSSRASSGKPAEVKLSRAQGRKINKAINDNDIAAVAAELDNGMNIDAIYSGGTILMKASNIGTADMVKMLISRGANLNYRNNRGDDALSVAMSNSRHWTEVVPALVEAGIFIDEKTPIWKLAFKTKKNKLLPEAKKMLVLLFAKGASPDSYTGKQKTTVIMYYAKKGWLEPLRFFIDQGANVNAKATDGQTALSAALTKPRRPENAAQKKERQEVVKLLKAKGAK